MVGWHHRLNGHEFEQTLVVGDGQGSLACCSPWGLRESDTTEQLNETKHSPQVAQIVKNLQNLLPLVNNIVGLQLVIDIF